MAHYFAEIESTQTFLKKLAQEKGSLPHLEFALAEVQTAGHGRHGRSWISEKGNLFLSLYLRDFSLPLTWIPHWVGTSLIQALCNLDIPEAKLKLKWPNDLVIDENKKAGGILCEKIGDGVVAGIGVNLISSPELNDRETASIHSLVPAMDFTKFQLKLGEELVRVLATEPSLEALQKIYQSHSLLTPGRAIHWVDLQTNASGSGTFVRYGNYGELIASFGGAEHPLYSEEIKLKL